eukprot:gene24014-31187_t
MPSIRDVRVSTMATGALGIMGNKGAVVSRFTLFDTSMCFVNAHFHSDKDSVSVRNADFHAIMDNTVLISSTEIPLKLSDVESSNLLSLVDIGEPPDALSISDHDYVFFMGDLNYRIYEAGITAEDVFTRCTEGDWEYLKSRDQLNCERASGAVFAGFEEGVLTFAPTYKYQPGTDLYERRSDKRSRAPA